MIENRRPTPANPGQCDGREAASTDAMIERMERAVALEPDQARHHQTLCELYRRAGQLDRAVHHGACAIALAPDDPASHYNQAIVHYDRQDIEAALACSRKAVALAPDMAAAHFELAEVLLLAGQFEEGWEEYRWRFRVPGVPPLLPGVAPPQWDGVPMPDSRLLLIADQGFGDAIQFSRYIPDVLRICPHLQVATSVELLPLMEQVAGRERCFVRWDAGASFDACCALSELPRLFGTRLASVPSRVPYLGPDSSKTAVWRQRLNDLVPRGYRRIGLVWAGRPSHGNDHNRSMPLESLDPLFALKGVALIALQIGPAQAEVARYHGSAPLINLGPEIQDFADTTAILAGLDRLVAVDTAVTHLAGAMGRPTSVLLPFAPDWRWLMGRTDSPWYPSLVLHRQHRPGDWTQAVASVQRLIRA